MRSPTEVLRQRKARDAAREARKLAESGSSDGGASYKGQRGERLTYEDNRSASNAPQGQESEYRHVSAGGRAPLEPTYTYPLGAAASAATRTYARQDVIDSDAGFQGTSRSDTTRTRAAPNPQEQPRSTLQSQWSSSRLNHAQSSLEQEKLRRTSTNVAYKGLGAADAGANPRKAGGFSFPQAFERWEALSNHWEGLTSYWLRRMEANAKEITQEPMAQQMSRHITDLTSAGANLFHAVVELQRLRASSERKFQRWFTEAGDKLRLTEEARKSLEQHLHNERARGNNMSRGFSTENSNLQAWSSNAQSQEQSQALAQAGEEKQALNRLIAEMKRELQISRDEARRAWEELGRREQEERNRMALLNEGNPISIGGVQVVPMSAASRGNSLRRPEQQDDIMVPQTPAASQSHGNHPYGFEQHEPSPTDTDPFSSGAAQPPQSPIRNPAYNPGSFITYAPGHMPAYSYSSSTTIQPSTRLNPQFDSQQNAPHSPTQQTHAPYLPIQQYSAQPSAPAYHHSSSFGHQHASHESQRNIASPSSEDPVPQNTLEPEHERSDSPSVHGGALSNITSAITTGFHTITDAVGITHHDSEEPAATGRHGENDNASSANREEGERERVQIAQYHTDSGGGGDGGDHSRTYQAAADYGGAGYAGGGDGHHPSEQTAAGSGGMDQLHHHPTRLSDVLEEDERSRTTRRSSGSGSRSGMY